MDRNMLGWPNAVSRVAASVIQMPTCWLLLDSNTNDYKYFEPHTRSYDMHGLSSPDGIVNGSTDLRYLLIISLSAHRRLQDKYYKRLF